MFSFFSSKKTSSSSSTGALAGATEIDGLPLSTDPCTSCADPCADGHAALPASLARKIEEGPLLHTMKPHARHLFVCAGSGSSWPEKIEPEALSAAKRRSPSDPPTLTGALLGTAFNHRRHAGSGLGSPPATMISAIDRDPSPESASDLVEDVVACVQSEVVLMPEFVVVRSLRGEDAPKLLDAWPGSLSAAGDPAAAADKLKAVGLDAVPAAEDAIVFVCNHTKRDKRCGVAGPLLIDEFRTVIAEMGLEDKVKVHGVSHIGGHKYAGNVIVYAKSLGAPGASVSRGVWYGRVKTCHVQPIVKATILEGKVFGELLRGASGGAHSQKAW
ncbi:Sucrase/ferredoxin-like-domain-containing protein [Zopfochytrium polystomum]|nr:Sucrase/ferredoxin-like-domain-containing protein [Zopfochytrium polystomum]